MVICRWKFRKIQAVLILAGSEKLSGVWCCSIEIRHPYNCPIPEAFHRSLHLIGWAGKSTFPNSVEKARNKQCNSRPTKYKISPLSDPGRFSESVTISYFVFPTNHFAARSLMNSNDSYKHPLRKYIDRSYICMVGVLLNQ